MQDKGYMTEVSDLLEHVISLAETIRSARWQIEEAVERLDDRLRARPDGVAGLWGVLECSVDSEGVRLRFPGAGIDWYTLRLPTILDHPSDGRRSADEIGRLMGSAWELEETLSHQGPNTMGLGRELGALGMRLGRLREEARRVVDEKTIEPNWDYPTYLGILERAKSEYLASSDSTLLAGNGREGEPREDASKTVDLSGGSARCN